MITSYQANELISRLTFANAAAIELMAMQLFTEYALAVRMRIRWDELPDASNMDKTRSRSYWQAKALECIQGTLINIGEIDASAHR